jgi:hypothetical protein
MPRFREKRLENEGSKTVREAIGHNHTCEPSADANAGFPCSTPPPPPRHVVIRGQS